MPFSPETYVLVMSKINELKALIDSADSDISTVSGKVASLEEAMPKKFERASFNLVSTLKTNIESSFSAASDKSLFNGTYTTTSYSMGWYGIKHTASATTKALFFYSAPSSSSIGILYRDSSGGWTAESIV